MNKGLIVSTALLVSLGFQAIKQEEAALLVFLFAVAVTIFHPSK